MTQAQRDALVDMMSAVLACSCVSPDLRSRATALSFRLRNPSLSGRSGFFNG